MSCNRADLEMNHDASKGDASAGGAVFHLLNWRSAKLFVESTIERIWHEVLDAGHLTTQQRLDIRLATTHALHEAKTAADIAWDAAGARLAVVRTRSRDDTGRLSVDIVEVDADGGAILSKTNFGPVLDAAPVGYAPGTNRLYVATVDQSGSALWSVESGTRQRIASFSPGRTRDWSLSPNGTRLAFVDVFGPGARSYAGSTFSIAARTVSVNARSIAAGNELGAVWRPGSNEPGFGGPGGSLQIAGSQTSAYLAPDSWSPDGLMLAARVYGSGYDPAGALEVLSSGYRIRLSDDPGAWLFGWVGGPPR